MKILVDMCLPPSWVEFLHNAGWEALHCSSIGPTPTKDIEVMAWAREHCHILFTHDLDFGAALALATESGPSIFQVTAQDLMTVNIGPAVVRTLRELESLLESGALVQVGLESGKARIFRLPISKAEGC
jgi:predicted nuclease of predicted toxin-antitoxin system